jgi:very-short-patch-repair endonuclease
MPVEINNRAPGGRRCRSRRDRGPRTAAVLAADRSVAELAARQHGVVSADQLVELGLSRKAIRGRIAAGRLHPIHADVYAVGHRAIDDHGRWLGAVLAGGPGAVLSHRSAAELWQIMPTTGRTPDVSAACGRRPRPTVMFHRPPLLDRVDITLHAGIPVTTPARTLLDLAGQLSDRQLESAFDEADRLDVIDSERLAELCELRGHRGIRSFRRFAARLLPAAVSTRSALEYRFLKLCRDHGLPDPEANVQVAGLEVDVLWRRQRLVVELDGHAYHRGRAAFERDRLRDATLQAAGHRVIRVTHRRLENDADGVLAAVARLISAPDGA